MGASCLLFIWLLGWPVQRRGRCEEVARVRWASWRATTRHNSLDSPNCMSGPRQSHLPQHNHKVAAKGKGCQHSRVTSLSWSGCSLLLGAMYHSSSKRCCYSSQGGVEKPYPLLGRRGTLVTPASAAWCTTSYASKPFSSWLNYIRLLYVKCKQRYGNQLPDYWYRLLICQ